MVHGEPAWLNTICMVANDPSLANSRHALRKLPDCGAPAFISAGSRGTFDTPVGANLTWSLFEIGLVRFARGRYVRWPGQALTPSSEVAGDGFARSGPAFIHESHRSGGAIHCMESSHD